MTGWIGDNAWTDGDAWTCPECEDTVRGGGKHRRHVQGIHARRHGIERGDLVEQARQLHQWREATEAAATAPLTIPAAPKGQRRGPKKKK